MKVIFKRNKVKLPLLFLSFIFTVMIANVVNAVEKCSDGSICKVENVNENLLNVVSEVEPKEEIIKVKLSEMSDENFMDVVTLQGLNKITAKISEFDVKVGEVTEFGRLEIKAHKCWKAPPEERPENKALLEIFEYSLSNRKEKKRIFYGWMFSSSPGLSALEHPMYDITVTNCEKSY